MIVIIINLWHVAINDRVWTAIIVVGIVVVVIISNNFIVLWLCDQIDTTIIVGQ